MSTLPARHTAQPDSHGAAQDTTHAAVPGPLTERDEALLEHVLSSAEVEGADVLLDQVRMLQLAPESTPTYRAFVIHPDAPRSRFGRGTQRELPGLFAVDSPGGRPLGELVVWVDHGHLSALEYVWYTDREPLTLPSPEWVTAEDPETAARVTGSARGRWIFLAAVLALCAALGAAAYSLGTAQGADVDAAREAGTAAGAERGRTAGTAEGAERGAAEGLPAGRESAYRVSYDAAFAKSRATAYRTTLRSERARIKAAEKAAAAASAAAATTSFGGTNCFGYRDARGYWICTG